MIDFLCFLFTIFHDHEHHLHKKKIGRNDGHMVRNDDFFSIFKVLFHAYIKNFKFSREINMAILIFKNKNKILEFFFFLYSNPI
jgi:hypothetical protein